MSVVFKLNETMLNKKTQYSSITLMLLFTLLFSCSGVDSGKKKTLCCNERYYIPSEITWLLKSLHFKVIDIYGCDTGDFSRAKPLTADDFEMLVIAQK